MQKALRRVFPQAQALDQQFFRRNTLKVAQELLGKVLAVRCEGQWAAGRIVETEGYRKDDPACHAFKKRTPRNEIMFGDPGLVYVYFIYGMYEMLNIVTEPTGDPGAVLIRAMEPLFGLEAMKARRPKARKIHELANGPGRLARALGVRLNHKGESVFGANFLVMDDGYRVNEIVCSPRVGIKQGTNLEWRYFVAGHACVSEAPQNKIQRTLLKGKS